MSKLTISLGQMNVRPGEVEHNLATFETMTAEAARRGSDLVIFPELWAAGYVLEEAEDYASAPGEGVWARIAEAARSNHITIIGAVMEKTANGVADSAPVISPEGEILGIYRKTHLFRLFDEDKHLVEGDAPLCVDLPWGKTGLAICYDLRFPELFRRYSVQDGARFIVIPTAWPLIRMEHWRTLLIARAIENQCFVMGCNVAGQSGKTVFAGHSMIVDPWGKVIVEAGETPQLITAQIEVDDVDEIRSKIPIFEDIRHDLYTRQKITT